MLECNADITVYTYRLLAHFISELIFDNAKSLWGLIFSMIAPEIESTPSHIRQLAVILEVNCGICMNTNLPFNATKLFEALQYQLLVAVEYCYALKPGQCVWVEVYGDVTVKAQSQIEVKLYSDTLNDGHANFWNTLKNWLTVEFNHKKYESLVLLTSQEFSPKSTLKAWNECTPDEKLALMQNILEKTDEAFKKIKAKEPSNNLVLQHEVMAVERRKDLIEILGKMLITTGAPSLADRIDNFNALHLKGIRDTKLQNYLDDLLGYIGSTKFVAEGWKISYSDFSDKIAELHKRYMKHSNTFPVLDKKALKEKIKLEEIEGRLFVKKIKEIGADHRVKNAALHLLIAEGTIAELYKEGLLFKSEMEVYQNNHLAQHIDCRELAARQSSHLVNQDEIKGASYDFFLARHGLAVQQLGAFEGTNIEFRNGVYHMLADMEPEEEEEALLWRLW